MQKIVADLSEAKGDRAAIRFRMGDVEMELSKEVSERVQIVSLAAVAPDGAHRQLWSDSYEPGALSGRTTLLRQLLPATRRDEAEHAARIYRERLAHLETRRKRAEPGANQIRRLLPIIGLAVFTRGVAGPIPQPARGYGDPADRPTVLQNRPADVALFVQCPSVHALEPSKNTGDSQDPDDAAHREAHGVTWARQVIRNLAEPRPKSASDAANRPDHKLLHNLLHKIQHTPSW
ncbi:hypothetical protein [Paracoccus isoporae]|nr:hypothetical protein [Paracoccus isoporae]